MELLKTTITGLFFGTFGTMLGDIIGICFKNASDSPNLKEASKPEPIARPSGILCKASPILTIIPLYVFLSGIATGFGAFLGAIIGKISQQIIAMCLAFAGGAMLYIVSGELSPE